MNHDLLPCPFCGGQASLEQGGGYENSAWSVGCNNPAEPHCPGYQSLTTFERQCDAVAAWNKRVPNSADRYEEGFALGNITYQMNFISPPMPINSAPIWRPIETAPKDGSWIMAWRPSSRNSSGQNPVIVRWNVFDDGLPAWIWPDVPYEVYSEAGRALAERFIAKCSLYETMEFTHWMPLPVPPDEG